MESQSMRRSVFRLCISPGHNYFGRHGKPAGEAPVLDVPEIECVAGHGIRGDRFFDYKPDYKGQITFFMRENLVRMWNELGISGPGKDPSATRRNVLTEGLDLTSLIGGEFEIQGIRFLGTEECRPCSWMNGAIHPGAEEWMKGRGGLRAKILTSGMLRQDSSDGLCSALIAGGMSSRMGYDKALMKFQGQFLWQRQLEILRSLSCPVAVAAPAPRSWIPMQTTFIPDAEGVAGPLAGLLASLEWTIVRGGTHLLALALDMPRLSACTLRRLWDSCSPGVGVVPRGASGYEPLAAIYPVQALQTLHRLASDGNWKLQDAVEALETAGQCRVFSLEGSLAAEFFNVNTPADLVEMEKI